MIRLKQIIFAAGIISIVNTLSAQPVNPLKFTSTSATIEKAILLKWQSDSNALYQIQYTPTLTNIQWNILVDNYPSQGTNTLWLDTGVYTQSPPIDHPKYDPTRFYRAAYLGTNPVIPPTINIIFPTNGMVLSGQVTVTVTSASSILPIQYKYLYVDGQEMYDSDDESNFVINTSEWANGQHTLFATVKGQSGLSGPSGSYPITVAYAASPYVPVTFSNLISQIGFSQPFFQPSLGQTQQVTAVFAANVNWTLQILNQSSNTVLTATGSGTSMQYNWDGTGGGETNIPDGVYYYLISAQTNGLAPQGLISGSFSSASLSESGFTELWAMPANSLADAVPLALYPMGFDTNNLVIFKPSQSQIQAQSLSFSSVEDASTFQPLFSGSSSQSSLAPQRPPTKPVKNSVGSVAVAYYNFPTEKTYANPLNGLGLVGNSGKVQIENSYGGVTFTNIPEAPNTANSFVNRMGRGGWKLAFNFSGALVRINDLRSASLGGKEIFGQANIGLFLDHGSYGTSLDFNPDANQSYDIYFASDNPLDASAPWLRLSEFGLGGNLRWMAILACNDLIDQNYQSMLSQGALPITSNLHLLCGSTTICYMSDDIGALWAKKMTGGIFIPQQSIPQAWFGAGHDAYQYATNITGTVSFRVAGSDNCFSDTLTSYPGSTSGNITFQDSQIYP